MKCHPHYQVQHHDDCRKLADIWKKSTSLEPEKQDQKLSYP